MATDYQEDGDWIDRDNFLRSIASDVTAQNVILEYVQNASDASARTFVVDIGIDSISFLHDGKPFNNDEITAFGKIAGTTKYFSGDHIGGFGRGAQSALLYCKELIVESGKYRLSIDPETFPFGSSLHDGGDHGDWTKFILKYREKTAAHSGVPFRAMSRSAWLEVIDQSHGDFITLLAILGGIRQRVTQIVLRTDECKRIYTVGGRSDYHLFVNSSSVKKGTATYRFSFRTAETEHGTVTVGQFDQASDSLSDSHLAESLSEGCFCNGLPMPISTRSSFLVDAPFRPDQTRHFLPIAGGEEQSQRNHALVRDAARLTAEWIESERDAWILTRRLATTLPSLALRGRTKDIGAAFVAGIRDGLKGKEIFPARFGTQLETTWHRTDKRDVSFAYCPEGSPECWPIHAVVPTKNDSVDVIANLFGATPTPLRKALSLLATNLRGSEVDLFSNCRGLVDWQADIAALLTKLRRKRERKELCDKFIFDMPVLRLPNSDAAGAPRTLILQEGGLSSQTLHTLRQLNHPGFIDSLDLGDIAETLLGELGDQAGCTNALSVLQDERVLAELGKPGALRLAQAPVWKNLLGEPRHLSQLFDGEVLPPSLRALAPIASTCLNEGYVAAAHRIAVLAGPDLRNFPTLPTITKAIRLVRKGVIRVCNGVEMPSEAQDLLHLGNLLLEHYELLRAEKAPQRNGCLRMIRSKWVPTTRSGKPVLVSPSEFAYPTDIAKSKFSDVLSFPPFGTETEWASTNGLLFCQDHNLVNVTRLSDLISLISTKDSRFNANHSELVYIVRQFIADTFPGALDRIGDTDLAALAVDCYSGRIALSASISPREPVGEWRQRTDASLSQTIRIRCWNLLTRREQGLCRAADYLEMVRRTGDSEFVLITAGPDVPDLGIGDGSKGVIPAASPHQLLPEAVHGGLRSHGRQLLKRLTWATPQLSLGFVVTVVLLALIYFLVVFKRLDTEIGAISTAVLVVFSMYVGFDWLRNMGRSRQHGSADTRGLEPPAGPFRVAIFLCCIAALVIGARVPPSDDWIGFGLLIASIGLVLCSVAATVSEIWQLQQHGLQRAAQEFLATPRWSTELLLGAVLLGATKLVIERKVAESVPILGALFTVFERTEAFAVIGAVVCAFLLFRRISGERANRHAIMQRGFAGLLMTSVVILLFVNLFRFAILQDSLQHAGSEALPSASTAPQIDLVLTAYIIPGVILFTMYLLWRQRRNRNQRLGEAILRWRLSDFFTRLEACAPRRVSIYRTHESAWRVAKEAGLDPFGLTYYLRCISDHDDIEIVQRVFLDEVKARRQSRIAVSEEATELERRILETYSFSTDRESPNGHE